MILRVTGMSHYSIGREEESKHLPVGLRISDSGNSSKFEVSSMLLISIEIAAGLSLPIRADPGSKFQRQEKAGFICFPLPNRLKD